MKAASLNADLERAARRLVWWKPPREALAEPHRFLAQVMVYGTVEDVASARRQFPEAAFRKVLAHPPPGVFDPRSWAYWHVGFALEPPKDIPRRALDEGGRHGPRQQGSPR